MENGKFRYKTLRILIFMRPLTAFSNLLKQICSFNSPFSIPHCQLLFYFWLTLTIAGRMTLSLKV